MLLFNCSVDDATKISSSRRRSGSRRSGRSRSRSRGDGGISNNSVIMIWVMTVMAS